MKTEKAKSNSGKLKIVWLCHFSNAELQEFLSLRKKVPEYAPWIKSLIQLFENSEDTELHIVSQHEYLTRSKQFTHKGIHYHIVRKGIPFIGRHWPRFFKWDRWTNYSFWKRKSKRIIDQINPDLVHMHGFENEFCGTIFQFKNRYPVFITVQGFIHQSLQSNKKDDARKDTELRIIKSFTHFGIRTKTMQKDLLRINPDAKCHWHQYPMTIPVANTSEKKYDIVFFARLTKDKGVEDLIRAAAIVINEFDHEIRVCMIGGGNHIAYSNLADELGIGQYIEWKGFLPTQQDVYEKAVEAKISVLPTYHDIISGTIIESLFLKIPVVAYDTGSIHEVNENENIIELVEKFNISELAKSIHLLLSDEKSMKTKSELGYQRMYEMFGQSDDEIYEEIKSIYRSVIEAENT